MYSICIISGVASEKNIGHALGGVSQAPSPKRTFFKI